MMTWKVLAQLLVLSTSIAFLGAACAAVEEDGGVAEELSVVSGEAPKLIVGPKSLTAPEVGYLWEAVQLDQHTFMFKSEFDHKALDANRGYGVPYLHPEPNPQNPNHAWYLAPLSLSEPVYLITSIISGWALDGDGGYGNEAYLSDRPDPKNVNHRWHMDCVEHKHCQLWVVIDGLRHYLFNTHAVSSS